MNRIYVGCHALLASSAIAFAGLPAIADVIVSGDPFAVKPDDLALNPDAGDENIFIGVPLTVNGVRLPRTGIVTVTNEGEDTTLSSSRGIYVGANDDTTGTLNVQGDGALVRGGGGLTIGGDSPFIGGLQSGVGTLNVTGGAGVEMVPDRTNSPFSTAGVFAASGRDVNGLSNAEAVINIDGGYLEGNFFNVGNAETGASGEVKVTNGGSITSFGTIDLPGGGIRQIGDVQIAENSSLTVSGDGSLVEATRFVAGFGVFQDDQVINPGNSAAKISVLDGGRIDTGTNNAGMEIGLGAAAEMVVSGAGSTLNVSAIPVDDGNPDFRGDEGDLMIGSTSAVYLSETETYKFAAGEGKLSVSNGGTVIVEEDVHIGGAEGFVVSLATDFSGQVAPVSSGVLEVSSDGSVTARDIFVHEGGILKGNGGDILADVILDGGIIAPGTSPGVMTIDGNLDIISGLLQIEIAGTDFGSFDQLFVSGDLIAPDGLEIEVSFLDGFMPEDGDTFNFLNIAGSAAVLSNPDLISLSVLGLDPGVDLAFSFGSGVLSLNASAVVGAVPVPAALPLMLTALAGLGFMARRRAA